ncbi:MAG: 50S ribosomal protein L3 N(5)-glutamine methyltransferase [Pseudomonadota bacterium]
MLSGRELLASCQQRLENAGLHYGHGTGNAADDALFLTLHVLGLGYDASEEALEQAVSVEQSEHLSALLQRRIEDRIPAAYLTQKMWFAGLEFFVDERVLIPRSPLAESIIDGFEPWMDSTKITRALEIGTGSGCIALALAHYFPSIDVVATDISGDALAVANVNLDKHAGLAERVRFLAADLYPPDEQRFDLIVTNPPYVPHDEIPNLPAEYHAEPNIALFAEDDGLEFIARILDNAHDYLNPGGMLFFDVGDRWHSLERTFSDLSFTWCELLRGGQGIGCIEQSALSKFNESRLE